MSTTEVVVGRVGRAHGVRGEVAVEPRTDEPDRRFAPGAVLAVRAGDGRLAPGTARPASLTVRRARWHQARLLVSFAELSDRDSAEALRGLHLVASVDVEESPEDPEEFYDHQLVGLAVVTAGEGRVVGEVSSVLHGTGQDLLVVSTPTGGEVLVPFVSALVPVVDVTAGRLEVADRPGLLTALDEPDAG
jgi:16S rRNA processing protein RimM